MIMEVYEADKAGGRADRAWLKAYGYGTAGTTGTAAPYRRTNRAFSYYDFEADLPEPQRRSG
jgi:hypothetical protein